MDEMPDTSTFEGMMAMCHREMAYNYTCETMENSLRSIQQARAWAMMAIAQELHGIHEILRSSIDEAGRLYVTTYAR
jgi:hypothetical protein